MEAFQAFSGNLFWLGLQVEARAGARVHLSTEHLSGAGLPARGRFRFGGASSVMVMARSFVAAGWAGEEEGGWERRALHDPIGLTILRRCRLSPSAG